MRTRLTALLLFFACGDSGGDASTTDNQTSAAPATTSGTTSAATTSATAGPTSGDATDPVTTTTSTDPAPTTGPSTIDATTTTGVTPDPDTTTTDTATTAGDTTAPGTTTTTTDDTDRPQCGGADVAAILDAFEECLSPGYYGQSKPIAGVTCWDICCAFGIFNCSHRSAQDDFNACEPNAPRAVGSCDEVFQADWSSQCFCLN